MHLPTAEKFLPKFKISQRAANNLVGLYYEMLTVKPPTFNQNDCDKCVIGHAMESGFINSDKLRPTGWDSLFDSAVKSIGLPDYVKIGGDEYCDVLQEFLFGGHEDIYQHGRTLSLPSRVDASRRSQLTPIDACVRIAAVLDRAGWDISELPEVL